MGSSSRGVKAWLTHTASVARRRSVPAIGDQVASTRAMVTESTALAPVGGDDGVAGEVRDAPAELMADISGQLAGLGRRAQQLPGPRQPAARQPPDRAGLEDPEHLGADGGRGTRRPGAGTVRRRPRRRARPARCLRTWPAPAPHRRCTHPADPSQEREACGRGRRWPAPARPAGRCEPLDASRRPVRAARAPTTPEPCSIAQTCALVSTWHRGSASSVSRNRRNVFQPCCSRESAGLGCGRGRVPPVLPAQLVGRVEDGDGCAPVQCGGRRGQPGRPGADDQHRAGHDWVSTTSPSLARR